MKSLHLYVFVAVLAAVVCPTRAHAGWTMVFNDEFDESQLNRDAWFTRYIYSGETQDRLNDEKEVYRDNDNHVVKDGHLSLVARSVGDGKYESGLIRSKRTFYYGYYEVRVKFPPGRGAWPAFWLNSDYDANGKLSWPPEVDIFEFVDNGKDDKVNMVHSAADGDDAGNKLTYTDPKFNTRWKDYVGDADFDLTKDWHVFGLMWLPDSLTVYMDGIKLYSQSYKWVYKDGRLGAPAHILLNFAIGGQWAGRYGIDDAAFPQSFDINYVRVYQFDPGKTDDVKIPNVPDLASYKYDAPGDLVRPIVYPAQLPAKVKPGQMMNVVYHVDTVPTLYRTKLKLSINDKSTGKSVFERSFDLPHDTRQGSSSLQSRVGLAIPDNLAGGDYDVRLALCYCLIPPCPPGGETNIPLTPQQGAVREQNAWYRIGVFKVED